MDINKKELEHVERMRPDKLLNICTNKQNIKKISGKTAENMEKIYNQQKSSDKQEQKKSCLYICNT